jgi:uncharacterized damage-inducible protein DinB
MKPRLILTLLLACTTALTAHAQTAPESGFRAEFLRDWADTSDKLLSLAEAIPADKYAWRPAEGVRSISEVLLHVAAANFGLPQRIGAAPPEGFSAQGYEASMTDKQQVVEALRQSLEHVREAALAMNDADADKTFDWFGGSKNTYRGMLLFFTKHTSEHLGQMIAYARTNGVVPPWSR